MKSVTWFEILVRVWTTYMVLGKNSLGYCENFDVIPGNLVFFQEIGRPPPNFQRENGVGSRSSQYVNLEPRLTESFQNDHHSNHHHHHHGKHYLKGDERFIRGEHDARRELPPNGRGRQGQLCRSRCSIIPDRDFCPTDIVEEIEADDYNSYEYSQENSVEYSEEYYSEEEEEEYDDSDEYDDNRRDSGKGHRKSRLRLTSSESRAPPGLEGRNASDSQDGSRLYLVYPPFTRFVAEERRKPQSGNGKEKYVKRSRVAGERRRRLQRRQRQMGRLIRLRPSALEQEMIIRWDRVVERGPFIGGDIVLPEGVLLRPPNFNYIKKQWPDATVPYELDSSLNPCRMNAIFDAMEEIEEKTCIRFVERKKERNYIDIRRSLYGCSSYVGMIGGAQHLNLSTGCFSKFTVTHELMHALGFDHEQSRKDRDKFIEIDFDNVIREKRSQFELNPSSFVTKFPYDIRSIMHYSAFLFAKNKCEPTIYPVDEKVSLCDMGIGNGRGGVTDCDKAKLNSMYKCGRKYSKQCKLEKSTKKL